jgi:hypothetical protein
VIDGAGLPLAVGLSAANTHDSQLWEQLVTRSRRSSGHGDGLVGRVDGRPSCAPARGRTSRPASGCCAVEGSARGSPAVGWSPASGWVGISERWSVPWPGYWPTGASRSALSAAPTSGHRLAWSLWRRRHQARARTWRYRRQANGPSRSRTTAGVLGALAPAGTDITNTPSGDVVQGVFKIGLTSIGSEGVNQLGPRILPQIASTLGG